MNEALKKFLMELSQDEALRERLVACGTMEEAYAIASERVEGFTLEDFRSAVEKLQEPLEGSSELTADDLQKVVGGAGSEATVGFTNGEGNGWW